MWDNPRPGVALSLQQVASLFQQAAVSLHQAEEPAPARRNPAAGVR
ncbi:Hypothetical protein CAP_6002 [Chondromyces apiculatus DSM 436]|uniref:Uncharacterized protein n=1 Tax=Chondromyces apiculatus DSM 436 TaxID=1192034 RepID=A0A017TI01_9BACT|nr:Hypothetical protein CAP_6002 [Chondromyces apiculatus DSM 436]